MDSRTSFPRQALPDARKGKKWRQQCMEWGDSKTYMHYSPVRKSVKHKQINYDLLNGKLHMDDLVMLLNPSEVEPNFLPETIQHFPIMNSTLETLIGEEIHRPFDWRAIVTNMNAVSEIEETKKNALLSSMQEIIEDTSISEEDYMKKMEDLADYYEYEYQDFREMRANEYIKQFAKSQNFPLIFQGGFRDALAVGEEIYQCDIMGGEPVLEKCNTQKTRIYRSGNSNKVEDADIIIVEDYWAVGKVFDVYGDSLDPKDVKYLDDLPWGGGQGTDGMDNIDETYGFIDRNMVNEEFVDDGSFFWDPEGDLGTYQSMQPFDAQGNVRVMRMYWKSRRRIKKVKMYDQETGDEYFEFFDDTYVPDESKGEEAEILWINEAWEGTMIGGHVRTRDGKEVEESRGILVNVRPRPVQYWRMDNPSKCSLGFVGTIYNLNDDKPFSMVDMMKPYNYLYDVIHYRLMDAIASMWGSMADVDLATIPEDWDVTQWMYFARKNHLSVRDSFREGNKGAATGKLAASLNNNSQRIVTDMTGDYIQQLMNIAAYIKTEMKAMVGVTPQREGQIANRETVGGVERSVLQSSYITERYFAIHKDTKRRALEMFVETAKIAARGRKISFRYKTSDTSWKLMEFEGDVFAEDDYGIVMDDGSDILNLDQKIEALGQAAIQNKYKLSAIMKMYTSSNSLSDKIRQLEKAERKTFEEEMQQQQMQMQAAQETTQAQMAMQQAELETKVAMNTENNETKILVAQIQADNNLQTAQLQNEVKYASLDAEGDGIPTLSPAEKAKLDEQIREFNINVQQDNKKIEVQKERNDIARIAARRKPASTK